MKMTTLSPTNKIIRILPRIHPVLFILLVFITQKALADPPIPPKGYRWVINVQFSDEFNGDALDMNKWKDTYGSWQGRPPAAFIPEAVSVKDGYLQIKSGVLDQPYRDYTIFGGAVSSRTFGAHFGYYECRAKASKIAMSTTFWMSNQKVLFEETDCVSDSYSQELDIQEAVGGGTTYSKFRTDMNSNTHFRYIKCGAVKEEFISKGTGTRLRSEVSDEFHIYGAWWKNANEVNFYADNSFFDHIEFRTDISDKPFDRPMKINMVTETYDWQPPPSHEDLLNDSINTAYYDWVRSYILVPVDKQVAGPGYDPIFEEELSIVGFENKGEQAFDLDYTYKSNADRTIIIRVIQNKKTLQTIELPVYAGIGHDVASLHLDFTPKKGKRYQVEAGYEGTEISQTVELEF